MLKSFAEFKFYQSFRLSIESADELRFMVEKRDELGKMTYIQDAKLIDISITGLGVKTTAKLSVGDELQISLQFKKIHLDITASVVRAFSDANAPIDSDEIIYGVEIEEDAGLRKLLEAYISSFTPERLKGCLIDSALKEKYAKASDGLEMFSLLLSLFKDITFYGDKDGFLDSMLEEVVRMMNATRASLFLINPETNELEAICALGVPKKDLKFDYRMGVAGSVFTTGVAVNIDVINDRSIFNDEFDKNTGFETKSIICHPIHNREDKIIGVIEVINKRSQDQFSVEDEKAMKVIALVFSSVFYRYNPISETSLIRRFSTPFDREYALIGKTPQMSALRSSILKTKDLNTPMLIEGESGVGKTLFAKILHFEGQRGNKRIEIMDCRDIEAQNWPLELWGKKEDSKIVRCQGGTLVLKEISEMPLNIQKEFLKVLKEKRLPDLKYVVDARFVATTSKDLYSLVDEGKFDRGLYEYFVTSTIFIAPLRRHIEDLPLLLDYFLKIECKKKGFLLKSFSEQAVSKLKAHDWPLNVTEVVRAVERAVAYNPKSHIIEWNEIQNEASPVLEMSTKRRTFGDIPFAYDFHIPLKSRVALVEMEMIKAEIKRCNGNKSKAAKEMGISREALRKKMIAAHEVFAELENTHKGHEGVAKAFSELKEELADGVKVEKKAA